MKITTTLEELEQEIMTEFSGERRQQVFEQYQEIMTLDKAAEVIADICEGMTAQADNDPVAKAAMDEWTPFERMAWIVKEAYVRAVLNTFECMAQVNAIGVNTIKERNLAQCQQS